MQLKHRILSGFSVLAVIAAGAAVPMTAAAEDAPSLTPDADAALRGVFQTMSGERLRVVSDDHEAGERTVVARSKSGDLVSYRIQFTSVTDADDAAMRAALLAPAPELAYSETPPVPEVHRVKAAPLAEDLEWTPVSAIASTDDTVSISWSEGKFDAELRSGKKVSSSNGQVVLKGLKPGSSYTATLSAPANLGESELERERIVQAQTLSTGGVTPMTYQQWGTAYVHKTFIQEASVSATYCANWPTYTFGGDGRGYKLPSFATPDDTPNYRTMMFANVNWDNPAPYDFVWSRNVGASKIYNNGSLVKTLYADTKDMLIKDIQAGSTYAKAYIDHWSSNPHCSFLDVNYGGAIRYAEWVEYYRSGTVAINGYRYKAPAHEMYGRFNTVNGAEIWQTITTRPNDGFVCLLGNGACGMDFYQKSASY